MICEEAAEFVSALCDGEMIPPGQTCVSKERRADIGSG